jgi:hypothetical protein
MLLDIALLIVGLGLVWAFFSEAYVTFLVKMIEGRVWTGDGPAHHPKAMVVFFTTGAIGALLILFALGRLWWRQRQARAKSRLPAINFERRVQERFFADGRLFRVPDKVRKRYAKYAKSADAIPTWVREDLNEWWEPMLERYPNPPATEHERQEREAEFWQRWTLMFVVKDAQGRVGIRPKQWILDQFKAYEKWFFRDYYAATGDVLPTIARRMSDLEMDSIAAGKMVWAEETSVAAAQQRAAIEKANDASQRFWRVEVDEHFEKWGGWFFGKVEETFQELNRARQEPEKDVYGEGGYATRDDIARAARGNTTGAAHSQEFED